MKENFQDQINEAAQRIKGGATPKKLLEEYATRYKIHEAFFIVTQAQISAKQK